MVGDDSALRARNDFGGSLLLLGLLLLESLCRGPKGLRVPLLVVGLYLGVSLTVILVYAART